VWTQAKKNKIDLSLTLSEGNCTWNKEGKTKQNLCLTPIEGVNVARLFLSDDDDDDDDDGTPTEREKKEAPRPWRKLVANIVQYITNYQ